MAILGTGVVCCTWEQWCALAAAKLTAGINRVILTTKPEIDQFEDGGRWYYQFKDWAEHRPYVDESSSPFELCFKANWPNIIFEFVKEKVVYVKGRHINQTKAHPNWVATATERRGKLLIRIDDINHPEFWMEITIKDGHD